jgi:hypothetical protein
MRSHQKPAGGGALVRTRSVSRARLGFGRGMSERAMCNEVTAGLPANSTGPPKGPSDLVGAVVTCCVFHTLAEGVNCSPYPSTAVRSLEMRASTQVDDECQSRQSSRKSSPSLCRTCALRPHRDRLRKSRG